MSRDLNCITISGRLTADAEQKTTQAGVLGSVFTLASGKDKNETNFIKVSFWGRGSEALHPYLRRGKYITVVGRLDQRKYEWQGQKREEFSIVADSIFLLPNYENSTNQSAGNPTTQQTTPPQTYQQSGYQQGYQQTRPQQQSYQPQQGYQPAPQAQPVQPSLYGNAGPESFEDDDIPF